MPYFKNLLVAVDQLGNAICGGNPDNTISARVGYFSEINQKASKYYWQGLAKVINFTFWPVDGQDHCKKAFEADPEEAFNDDNRDIFRVLISVVIVASCVPISAILYVLYPFWKLFGI